MMELFAEADFEPVDVDGEVVHPMYRAALREGDCVRVTWLGSHSPRVQGLSLRLRLPDVPGRRGEAGRLRVDDVEAPTIVLWTDTAPPVVEATCVRLKPGGELRISNRWRLSDGREDEWLNNFGMKIERLESPAGVILRCSDGYGDKLTFDDLVARIEIFPSAGRDASNS